MRPGRWHQSARGLLALAALPALLWLGAARAPAAAARELPQQVTYGHSPAAAEPAAVRCRAGARPWLADRLDRGGHGPGPAAAAPAVAAAAPPPAAAAREAADREPAAAGPARSPRPRAPPHLQRA